MSAITDRKRSIGIAAMMVLGLLAGFVVASTASGEAYATVDTVAEDNQAYTLPLEEDQRIRFMLEAHEDAANAEATFAVYDPQDRFFGQFMLDGDEDDVELLADQSGPWVVFVTETVDADLAVQFSEDDRAENGSAEDVLREIEVTSTERTVADQEGGELDETLALRLDHRPAAAFLEFEGDIAGLDAAVASDEGIVYEIRNGAANVTENGTVDREGQTQATPSHLAEGSYRIEATAESFSGTLTFVTQTYDRGAAAPQPAEPEAPEQPNPLEDASIVAAAEEHEAYKVPMQGHDELLLAVKDDTSAKVFIYDSEDALVDIVEIDAATYDRSDDHDHDDWDQGPPAPEQPEDPENESDESKAPFQAVRVNATDSEHVVYVDAVHGDEDAVLIALPDASAAKEASQLEIEAQQIVFEHDSSNDTQTAHAELTGGLVGLAAHSQEAFAMEREITVEGPLGQIAHIQERAKTFGFALSSEYDVEEEHFSSGTIDVTFSQESLALAQGETTIELVHYVR